MAESGPADPPPHHRQRRGDRAILSECIFEPFPPALLASITSVPNPASYGFEALPFLRWLAGHLAPQSAMLVDDGSGLAAPVLQAALPATCTYAAAPCPDAAAPVDLIHATTGTLDKLLAQLAPSGLLVLEGAADQGIHLPVGDGISILAAAEPPPVFHFLAAQDEPSLAALAAMFNALGRQIAKAAALEGRAGEIRLLEQRLSRSAAKSGETEATLRREGEALRAELARVVTERDAITHSTSWRLTSPLRRALLAVKQRRQPAPAPATPPALAPGATTDEKAKFKREAAKALDGFLEAGGRLALPRSDAPDVSILLVLYNQAALTYQCIRSILESALAGVEIELVIVDNASSDETAALLDRVDGATIIRNTDNRHFLHGVNQAAAAARGRDILLLNNDAKLRGGALAAAVRSLHAAPDIGAVGAKIILPGGALQEAGSIVWNDGTCQGYGRGSNPDLPAFQFRRNVDFCSGAFILIRGDLFRRLGGLDAAFAPAYYEEVDLCMRLHDAGFRIVYEPDCVIEHYEFASSATAEDAFALQRRNHALFAERYRDRLRQHHLPPGSNLTLARMDRGPRRLLYIDDRVPYPELGSGYPRAARLLREMVEAGWLVTFYPAHDPADDWADTYAAFPREVEFMLDHGYAALPAFLQERDGAYDTILVSRPHNMRGFLAARGATQGTARLIYDAEALFATREFLRLEQVGRPASAEHRRAVLAEETALTATAATVTTVNEREASIFRQGGHNDVRVLGLGVEAQPIPAGFMGRHDFLFVGTLDEDESPNVDALAFFVDQVMPKLSALLGRPAELTVAGRCRSTRAQLLAGRQIHLLGLVGDLTPFYAAARVFVAPHRYAAGLPLKVQEAASRGLPVVASTLLKDQLGWTDGRELLAATGANGLAAACARLHDDPALWHALRRGALDRLTADAKTDEFGSTLRAIMQG